MLFEAHLGVRQGEQGLLTSPVFMESSASCKIDFYYHMKGKNMGILELFIVDENGGKFSLTYYFGTKLYFISSYTIMIESALVTDSVRY